ncbi:uncharacterized protein N7469_002323 [Penicillium citrinum]|uniref:Uncharacterized protein n=1 Tax=Penicillium citrinum TaxID=5077 RepID=A0A9W9PD63_PENCI|nr:uncharacterized protein N7469_002323 [Penicillium citrinum]KAJ5240732.1 hypothetical protein N7469_002323 [Penicillium citrinum]
MPPIRTKSSQKPANQEGKILLALDNIKNNCIKSVYTAAKLYNIFYTLYNTVLLAKENTDLYTANKKKYQKRI